MRGGKSIFREVHIASFPGDDIVIVGQQEPKLGVITWTYYRLDDDRLEEELGKRRVGRLLYRKPEVSGKIAPPVKEGLTRWPRRVVSDRAGSQTRKVRLVSSSPLPAPPAAQRQYTPSNRGLTFGECGKNQRAAARAVVVQKTRGGG